MNPQPTLSCVGRIEKRLIKNSLCHPELAAPLVADEKEAYKGGCSQSISGSYHLQEYTDFNINKSNVGVETPTYNNISLNTKERSIIWKCLRHHSPRRVAFTLAEVFSPYYLSPSRIAFTLAEVLITLGIIGVVAAMTMPTLLQKVESEVIKSQFKKAYSVLSQAYIKAEADLGYKPSCAYGLTNTTDDCTKLRETLEKNLSIIKICENNALKNGCFPKSSYEGIDTVIKSNNPDLSEEELKDVEDFITANCSGYRKSNIENNSRAVVLKDGVILFYYDSIAHPAFIAVDVNGTKGPNKWGYDLFSLEVISSASKPLYLVGNAGCMPVEKGGMNSQNFLKNLYK